MTKKLIILSFVCSLIYSVWIYFARDTRSLRENIEQARYQRQPWVRMEDFHIRRYAKYVQQGDLRANHGRFFSPNKVIFNGAVDAWRVRNDGRQALKTHRLVANFLAKGMADILNHGTLQDVQLSTYVNFHYGDISLQTEEAKYTSAQDQLSSEKFVRVSRGKSWFTGRDGFVLLVKKEELNVFGKVRGNFEVNP